MLQSIKPAISQNDIKRKDQENNILLVFSFYDKDLLFKQYTNL